MDGVIIVKMECPDCNSENIIKKGEKKRKFGISQKYKCKDCDRYFHHYPGKEHIKRSAVTIYRKFGLTYDSISKMFDKYLDISITPRTLLEWNNNGVKPYKDWVFKKKKPLSFRKIRRVKRNEGRSSGKRVDRGMCPECMSRKKVIKHGSRNINYEHGTTNEFFCKSCQKYFSVYLRDKDEEYMEKNRRETGGRPMTYTLEMKRLAAILCRYMEVKEISLFFQQRYGVILPELSISAFSSKGVKPYPFKENKEILNKWMMGFEKDNGGGRKWKNCSFVDDISKLKEKEEKVEIPEEIEDVGDEIDKNLENNKWFKKVENSMKKVYNVSNEG